MFEIGSLLPAREQVQADGISSATSVDASTGNEEGPFSSDALFMQTFVQTLFTLKTTIDSLSTTSNVHPMFHRFRHFCPLGGLTV